MMTHEKLLAETYICNSKCQDGIHKDYTHCITCTRPDDFLMGLRVGELQWHKIDDGDLPEDGRTVLDEAGDRFYCFRGHFYYEDDSRFDCQPIAWCEIPTFKEAETNE